MFERIMPLQAPSLLAIATEDGRVQIERMASQNRAHGDERYPHQRFCHLRGPSVRETLKEPTQRIRGREPGNPQ